LGKRAIKAILVVPVFLALVCLLGLYILFDKVMGLADA
jgi:hypothetical protein